MVYTWKLFYCFFILLFILCSSSVVYFISLCVCVCERERERERDAPLSAHAQRTPVQVPGRRWLAGEAGEVREVWLVGANEPLSHWA